MLYFNSQFSSVLNGTYRIRSKNPNNTYLDCAKDGSVTLQRSNHGASQEWTISPAADGDYEIRSQVGALRVNNLDHLVCNASGQSFTWNIDPRGPDSYTIGEAATALAIQPELPINSSVIVDIRNNGVHQRWSLETASASGGGGNTTGNTALHNTLSETRQNLSLEPASVSVGDSSGGNTTGNTALHNNFSAGVMAVPGFTWNVQPDLRSIDDLPFATQMMAYGPGPDNSYMPTQADFEALQVARWALDCFVSAVPITHPGGRGNYDLFPGAGWVSPYLFQRLLDIASLHHATRAVPITHPSGTPGDVPSALQNATSSWDVTSRNLFSFCFRLHQALVQAGAIVPVTGNLSGIKDPLSTPNLATKTTGFPTGTYFEIRARGSNDILLTHSFSGEDGAQIQLWPRPLGGGELRAAAFFIDRTGALCHGSGLNVDVVDNVPILRQRRPVMTPPNHWSHPFPQFSYENSQIQIRFYSDPALPSCSHLYPNESWRNSQFVLARNSQQNVHMHPLSDFQPWALRVPFTPLSHWGTAHTDSNWRIVVEPRSENIADETLWDIIPLTS